jgi:hypothetical protein
VSAKLAFHGDNTGVYAETPETPAGKFIYPRCATHQTVAYKTSDHDNPAKLVNKPLSPYY